MAERKIDPKFNIHKIYKKMMFLNPYRNVGGGGGGLLLDLFPDAQFAYSLQKLKTGVVNVIRVERTNDNTQRDFTATEITNGTLIDWVGVGNNGFVKIWYDQTSNGRHLNFLGLTNKIVNNGALLLDNGMPYIDYTGDSVWSDYILYQKAALNNLNGSLFATYKSNEVGRTTLFLSKSTGYIGIADNGNSSSPNQNVGTPIFYKNGNLLTSPQDRNKLHEEYIINEDILESVFNIGFLASSWLDIYVIPFVYNLAAYSGALKAREFVVYNSDQTANKEGIESNIKSRYNI